MHRTYHTSLYTRKHAPTHRFTFAAGRVTVSAPMPEALNCPCNAVNLLSATLTIVNRWPLSLLPSLPPALPSFLFPPPPPPLLRVFHCLRDPSPLLVAVQFTMSCIGQQNGYDAAGEIAKADAYPHIRTMTVGQTTTSYQPLSELRVAAILPWSVASAKSIGSGNWTATSASIFWYTLDLTFCYTSPCVAVVGIVYWPSNEGDSMMYIMPRTPLQVFNEGRGPVPVCPVSHEVFIFKQKFNI